MFKKILVPIDLTEPAFADKSMGIAVEQARQHQADLHVMTVLPGFGMPIIASYFPDDAMDKARKETEKQLHDYVAAKVPDDVTVTSTVGEGSPYEQIVKQAKKIKADLIVIRSHDKRPLEEILLGSCAQKVVEHAPCSVMVVRVD
ncbi:MAG: universal stress protein [Acidiferrobacterales bacterium]